MNQTAIARSIEAEEVFSHPPGALWTALTSGQLIARWLMQPTGFEAVEGARFTFQTRAAGSWDGVIHCQVLEVVTNERLSYSWKGGHPDNVGYGAPLDTVVTFTLQRVDQGTRLRVRHSGFELPRNQTAFDNMGPGWTKVIQTVGALAGETP